MNKNHNIDYINCGQFGQDVLSHFTEKMERFVEGVVKERGISLTTPTLERLYYFTELYSKQITDTIVSEALNDRDVLANKEFINTNIYRP